MSEHSTLLSSAANDVLSAAMSRNVGRGPRNDHVPRTRHPASCRSLQNSARLVSEPSANSIERMMREFQRAIAQGGNFWPYAQS